MIRTLVVQAALICFAGAAFAQAPALGAGDSIMIHVLGHDELSREASVQAGGEIALPLFGRVSAEGLTPGALEEQLERLMLEREIDSRPDVSIEVTRWRDVIVSGAVGATGAVPWRPGLTAASAAALAGGERSLPSGLLGEALTALQAIEAQAALAGRLRALAATEARLEAQLGVVGSEGFPTSDPPYAEIAFPPSVAAANLSGLRAAETQIFASFIVLERAQHASLLERRSAIVSQIEALVGRVDALEEQEALIADEQESVTSLEASGLVPRPRLLEIQRERADVAADRLEAIALLADARRERAEIELSLDTFGEALVRDISLELADARAQRAEIEARMPASRQAAGIASEQSPGLDRDAGDARFTLLRATSSGLDIRPIRENEPLLPGDLLRVGRPVVADVLDVRMDE
jgi:hypothetical protein